MARVLNVVAHHDDDLLFLSPDLMHDIRDGNTVRTVFLVASDYHDYPAYMEVREHGVRSAYAAAAEMDVNDWRSYAYGAGHLGADLWTLGDKVSILETRMPDNGTAPLSRLWNCYKFNQSITGRPLENSDAQTTDRSMLIDFLRTVIADFQPDIIRTTDPSADQHGQNSPSLPLEGLYFHRDHVAAARFVMTAMLDVDPVPQVVYYRDYTSRDEDANLSQADEQFKREIFREFAFHDVDICPNPPNNCPPSGGFYDDLLFKQYEVDSAWIGDRAIPLPESDPTEPWPVIDEFFNIRNRGTNLEMAVNNASTANGAPLIGWEHTGTANQRWQLTCNAQGWEFIASHSGKAWDVPASSQSSGTQLTQFTRTGLINQTARLRGNPTDGWRMLFAHSGLALTVQGSGNGAAIVQQPFTGAANQLWDLIPA